MKKYAWVILILALFLTPQLWADDTDIYGTSSISIPPNVLIIFDTSGSMTTQDVPGDYYDPATTYTCGGSPCSYTSTVVYQKVQGWGSYSYDPFASSIDDLNCPDVKTALETDGYKTDAEIMDSAGGYVCGGSGKDLYLGNWINYDESNSSGLRTRTEVAKEVITQVINDTDDVRFGLMRFNNNSGDDQGGYVVAECGTDKTTLTSIVSNLPASGYTPLAETLAEAGLYLAGKPSWFNGSSGSYDYNCDTSGSGCKLYTSPMQERCQKNYIILMTDGASTQDQDSKLTSGTYINGDTIGDYDNDGEDPGSYSDNGSDYLDDVAKYLYENDTNSFLGTSGGSFEKQNVIVYTIGFRTDNQLLAKTAYNGGGIYYTANSISGLTAAFKKIMTDIADVNAVYTSPVVPVSRANKTFAGNYLYVGFFKPQADGKWGGNLKKYGLDNHGDIVDADGTYATQADGMLKDNARSFWSTSPDGADVLKGGIGAKLLDQATRNLYTYIESPPSGALPSNDLTASINLFSTTNTEILPGTLDVTTTTEKDSVIDDIYGVGKAWKLGDILHSTPAVVHYDINGDGDFDDAVDEDFIFSASNDGMIHCFKDSDGSEVWGFIPPDQLTRLKLLSDGSTDHKYFLDGVPVVSTSTGQKILFFGERRGGYNYYALDVTTYDSPTYKYTIGPTFLVGEDGNGDFTADGAGATLGQSWSKPTVHKIKTSTATSDTVFLMAGGYDDNQDKELNDPANPPPPADPRAATDSIGKAVFTIKVSDGTISKFNVNAGYYTDMTHCIVDASGFDTNGNGYTNRIYAGDLGGNMFAFKDDGTNEGVAPIEGGGDGVWSRRKLFSASVDGVQRKIFYSPDAIEEEHGERIFFGTGDRADPNATGVVNRIYVVKNYWDDPPTTLTESDLTDVTEDLIVLGTAQEQVDTRAALANSKGWYIRLDQYPGEKIISSVTVFGGVLYFTTYTPDTGTPPSDPCEVVSSHGQARLYALNYKTGEAAFEWSDIYEEDSDGNEVTKGRHDRVANIGTSISSAPVIVVLRGGPRGIISIAGGMTGFDPDDKINLHTIYWKQMNN
jgi:type IV pilus assembly protein PilY1